MARIGRAWNQREARFQCAQTPRSLLSTNNRHQGYIKTYYAPNDGGTSVNDPIPRGPLIRFVRVILHCPDPRWAEEDRSRRFGLCYWSHRRAGGTWRNRRPGCRGHADTAPSWAPPGKASPPHNRLCTISHNLVSDSSIQIGFRRNLSEADERELLSLSLNDLVKADETAADYAGASGDASIRGV